MAITTSSHTTEIGPSAEKIVHGCLALMQLKQTLSSVVASSLNRLRENSVSIALTGQFGIQIAMATTQCLLVIRRIDSVRSRMTEYFIFTETFYGTSSPYAYPSGTAASTSAAIDADSYSSTILPYSKAGASGTPAETLAD